MSGFRIGGPTPEAYKSIKDKVMTKQFTEGCAVDVCGCSKEIISAIFKKNGEGVVSGVFSNCNYLLYNGYSEGEESGGGNAFYFSGHSYSYTDEPLLAEILTPTDILGEHLVKAIEEGYKPHYKGDEREDGLYDLVMSDGERLYGINPLDTCKTGTICIAYKQSAITRSVATEPSIESVVLTEKLSPTSFLLLSDGDHQRMLMLNDSINAIKESDCKIAKALMKEVFQDLIDELNKEG